MQKMDAKTAKGVFIGYEKSGGYRFWVPSGHGGWGHVVTSLTAVFFESRIPKVMAITLDGELPSLAESQPIDEATSGLGSIQEDIAMEPAEGNPPTSVDEVRERLYVEPRAEKQLVRRSTRIKNKSVRRLAFEESHNAEETPLISELSDPVTLQEAMSRPDAEQWRQAMNAELDSLRRNGTYEEMFRPPKVRPVQTKWVFRRKTLADGSLDRYKARLVAKGFTQ